MEETGEAIVMACFVVLFVGMIFGFFAGWLSFSGGFCECMRGRHAYGCPKDGEE